MKPVRAFNEGNAGSLSRCVALTSHPPQRPRRTEVLDVLDVLDVLLVQTHRPANPDDGVKESLLAKVTWMRKRYISNSFPPIDRTVRCGLAFPIDRVA